MYPGRTTKLSEGTFNASNTISPKSDLVYINTAGTINFIVPNFGGGFSGFLIIMSNQAGVILGPDNASGGSANGNIAIGGTLTAFKPATLIYSKQLNRWFINTGV